MKKLLCLILVLMCLTTAFAEESLQQRFTGEEPNESEAEVPYEMIDGIKVGTVLLSYSDWCDGGPHAMTLLDGAAYMEEMRNGMTGFPVKVSMLIEMGAEVSLVRSELYGWPSETIPDELSRQIEYYEFLVRDTELGDLTILVQCGYEVDGGEWTGFLCPELEAADPIVRGAIVNCEKWVSLREEPDTSSKRIIKVLLDENVRVLEDCGDFYYCEYEGEHGYILSNYVHIDTTYTDME